MSLTVVLTSMSELKREVVKRVLPHATIVCVNNAGTSVPEQPINSGAACARMRADRALTIIAAGWDLVISMESEISTTGILVRDCCHVLLLTKDGQEYRAISDGIPIPGHWDPVIPGDYQLKHLGSPETYGSTLATRYGVDPKNWMADVGLMGRQVCDRRDQMENPLREVVDAWAEKEIPKTIIVVPDFPKPGVLYQDLSDVLAAPHLLEKLVRDAVVLLKREVGTSRVKVMGLDARGFIYGSLIAHALRTGFIMARKKGKLPRKTVEVTYATEYSTSTIEVMVDLIQKGDRVVVVDDLVATGGSLKAACQLVERCGGTVVACLVVLSVPELLDQAVEKLAPVPVHVLY